MTKINVIFFIFVNSILALDSAYASAKKNLPVPRFVSIKFNEVNARTGPDSDTPIEWVYIKKNEPVEVIREYDLWRKIRDFNNDTGWVHASVIAGKKFVIYNAPKEGALYESPNLDSNMVAKLMPKIRCALIERTNDWCKVNCQNYTGYVQAKNLWGVCPSSNEK